MAIEIVDFLIKKIKHTKNCGKSPSLIGKSTRNIEKLESHEKSTQQKLDDIWL
jgi:hypothetical protein